MPNMELAYTAGVTCNDVRLLCATKAAGYVVLGNQARHSSTLATVCILQKLGSSLTVDPERLSKFIALTVAQIEDREQLLTSNCLRSGTTHGQYFGTRVLG